MRLDSYLSGLTRYTRSKTRTFLKQGVIFLDGVVIKDGSAKILDDQVISIYDRTVIVKEQVTILLHKPAGYVCSNIDEGGHASWKHLIADCPYKAMLEVAGRLDFDTEGLVVATSDGQLAHRLISPKRKLPKTYYLETRNVLTQENCLELSRGVVLEDGYATMEATCEWISDHSCRLTIHEGKYHQIKRMLQSLGNEVTYLKREQFGEWTLERLEKGEWRYV